MLDALHSTRAVLNPVGVKIVLEIMERSYGVTCTAENCSSKEEIEQALMQVLGHDAGKLVINEWNKKISGALQN